MIGRVLVAAVKRLHPVPIGAAVLMCLGISLLLVAGPHLQLLAIGLISGVNNSIYSNYSEQGAEFYASYAEWLGASLQPEFLIVSALVVLAIKSEIGARTTFRNATIAFFSGLMSVDVLGLVLNGGTTLQAIQCIAANLAGSLILAGSVVLALDALHSLKQLSEKSNFSQAVVTLFTPFCLAIGLNSVLYLIGFWLLEKTDSPITVTLAPPIRGAYSTVGLDAAKQPQLYDHAHRFGILTNSKPLSPELSWIGYSKSANLSWDTGVETAEVSIRAIEGCQRADEISTVKFGTPHFVRKGVSKVSVSLDSGSALFSITGEVNSRVETRLVPDELTMFWIAPDAKEPKPSVTLFTGNDVTLRGSHGGKPITFIVMVPFSLPKRNSRVVSLEVDSVSTKFHFTANPEAKWSSPLVCRKIPLRNAMPGKENSVVVDTVTAGIAITITPSADITFEKKPSYGKFSLAGINGWIQSGEQTQAGYSGLIQNGYVTDLIVSGESTFVMINKELADSRKSDHWQVHGSIAVSALEDGSLTFQGSGRYLYRDGLLANTTRWDRIPWELKLIILGGLSALFLWCGKQLVSILGQNKIMGEWWKSKFTGE